MTTTNVRLSLILLLFLATVGSVLARISASEPTSLRYSLKQGESYRYTMQTSLKQSLGDMEMNTSMEAENDIILNVRASAPEKTTIEVSYSKLKMSVAGLSSAGIPDTTAVVDIKSGVTETLELTSDGTVSRKTAVKTPQKQEQTPDRGAILERLSKQALRYLLLPLPQAPTMRGETWTTEQRDTTNGITVTAKWTYTFTGETDTLGRKCVVIDCSSHTMTMEGTTNQMGIAVTLEGEGAGAGTLTVELANGMAISGKITTQFDVRLAITGQENMIMPLSMETTNSFSRKIK